MITSGEKNIISFSTYSNPDDSLGAGDFEVFGRTHADGLVLFKK
jgi:hypothetical protein